jgi:regulator of protease activity HflC (stomatin/prohibitin superfamily)
MTVKSANPASAPKSTTSRDTSAFRQIILLLLSLAIISSFFVVVDAGHRGVLMKFGEVQPQILGEGIHFVVPIVHTVEKLSVRVQNQEISAEASSKDLQDVYTDVALNWHLKPEEVNLTFRQIGDQEAVVDRLIKPAVEEILKAVVAKYTAEEVITRRGEVKASVDNALTARLSPYHIAVDDISLVHVHFSERFSDAVEAKQIAEQEAKRAEFVTLKTLREAEAKVNLARGEAEVQRLLRENLTPEILQRRAIDRWDGTLPLIMGDNSTKILDLDDLVTAQRPSEKQK